MTHQSDADNFEEDLNEPYLDPTQTLRVFTDIEIAQADFAADNGFRYRHCCEYVMATDHGYKAVEIFAELYEIGEDCLPYCPYAFTTR